MKIITILFTLLSVCSFSQPVIVTKYRTETAPPKPLPVGPVNESAPSKVTTVNACSNLERPQDPELYSSVDYLAFEAGNPDWDQREWATQSLESIGVELKCTDQLCSLEQFNSHLRYLSSEENRYSLESAQRLPRVISTVRNTPCEEEEPAQEENPAETYSVEVPYTEGVNLP